MAQGQTHFLVLEDQVEFSSLVWEGRDWNGATIGSNLIAGFSQFRQFYNTSELPILTILSLDRLPEMIFTWTPRVFPGNSPCPEHPETHEN